MEFESQKKVAAQEEHVAKREEDEKQEDSMRVLGMNHRELKVLLLGLLTVAGLVLLLFLGWLAWKRFWA